MKKIIKNILLVDDDEVTNVHNKNLIEKSGLVEKVTVVGSGMDALSLLRMRSDSGGIQPELILLDTLMPVMDGWQFAEEFKKLTEEKNFTTKIVMLSGTQEEIQRMETIIAPHIS